MKVEPLDRRALPRGAAISSRPGSEGWPIRVLEWPREPGTARRGALVFAGGRGDFLEKYLEPLAHWRARGWDVASFEWRGQGGSRGAIVGGHVDSFDPLVADGEALIAAWAAASPGPRVAIAHSMGGHLLLRILAERRPPLDAAVLVAPMIAVNAAPVPAWLGSRLARLLCRFGWNRRPAWRRNERPAPAGSSRQAFLTSCSERYGDEMWWRDREPGFNLGPPSWGWLRAAYASGAAFTPKLLGSVETPLLILGARRDRLVSPAAIRRAAALLPGAELFMYENSAHEILRESDAIRLDALARIDAFLDRRIRA